MIGGCNWPMIWWKAVWSTCRSVTDIKPKRWSGCPDEQATCSWAIAGTRVRRNVIAVDEMQAAT